MPTDQDARAVGAAITTVLCRPWEHDGPCPIAPHHTSWSRDGDTVSLRVLFAADPADKEWVRASIDDCLADEHLPAPDGATVGWRVRSSQSSQVEGRERDHVASLIAG